MKVYTKTGDRGTTSLIGGERVRKPTSVSRPTGPWTNCGLYCAAVGPASQGFLGTCGDRGGAEPHSVPADDGRGAAGVRRTGRERVPPLSADDDFVAGGADRRPAGNAAGDRQVYDSGRASGGFAAEPCLPNGLPASGACGAAGECGVRDGWDGSGVVEPPVGLFLCSGSDADAALRG